MDIVKVSQGGQSGFESINTKSETIKVTQNEVSPRPNQTELAQNNNNNEDTNTPEENKKININDKELQKALKKLSDFIADDNTKVEYQYHDKFKNDLMIKIVNKDTNETILEVPPKKILDLVAKMMEMVGVLFDKKA